MSSSFDCLLVEVPGHGVWGAGYNPFVSLVEATRGGHGLVLSEPPKTNCYQHGDRVLQMLEYHPRDNAGE